MVAKNAAMSLLLAVLLAVPMAGCSSSADSGMDEPDAQAASVGEASSSADYVGYWKVTDNGSGISETTKLENSGAAVFYLFEEDQTLKMIAVLAGERYERTGSWSLNEGEVAIDLPASTEKGEDVLLDGPAVSGATVEVSGNSMRVEGVSPEGSTIVLQRSDEASFDGFLEKSREEAERIVKPGETVSTEGYSFTLNSLSFVEEIYPSDTSSYYNYYPDQPGMKYLVAELTYKNEWTNYVTPGWSTDATFDVGGNMYSATVEVDGGTMTSQNYSIDPKVTNRLIVWASIPDEVVNSGSPKLSWSFPKDPSLLNAFYSDQQASEDYLIAL